jgi:hypothetical protein
LFALAAVFLPGAAAQASGVWYVDGTNGSDANGCLSSTTACKTIGHAIALASSGDTIKVAAGTYSENLTIAINLIIKGADPRTTIIDGGKRGPVLSITAGTVTFSDLTIQNGLGGDGGGIYFNSVDGNLTIIRSTISGNSGSGIFDSEYGNMTITDSTISGNSTGASGGGVFASAQNFVTITNSTLSGNSASNGGGIWVNNGIITVANSTISGNSATTNGGGINNEAVVVVTNSTITGNNAGSKGGGIFSPTYSTLTVASSTLSGNGAGSGGGAIFFQPGGTATATIQNSIVANSPTGNNCNSSTITSLGYNLSTDYSCRFGATGDRLSANARLGSLQMNGGPTATLALLAGSPAIDAGNPSGCTDGNGTLLTTDQRGSPRPDAEDNGIGCDIGAYERQAD